MTLAERLQWHLYKPVNKLMAEFLSDGTPEIELLEKTLVANKKELEAVEFAFIDRFQPELVVNHKGRPVSEPKVQIVQQKVITKFKIVDMPSDKAYVINWTDENKKKQKKKFRYGRCGTEAAMAKAEEFKAGLIKHFYG